MEENQLNSENCDTDDLLPVADEKRQSDSGRRKVSDRRSGIDQRYGKGGYDGEDRRTGQERRSDWDRRRGPGIRRTDDRRAAEEGEMSDEQFEYIKAIEEYKRVNKRPFPSYTEILEILKALGYRKTAEPYSLSAECDSPESQNTSDHD